MNRVAARWLVAASAAVPSVASIYIGWVVQPLYVAPSLPTAYEEIGTAIWSSVVVLIVGAAILVALVALAWRQIEQERGSRWNARLSVWRVLKWSAVLYWVGFVLCTASGSLLSIRIGRLVEGFYDDPAFSGGAGYGVLLASVAVAFWVGGAMFLVDVATRVSDRQRPSSTS